MAISTARSSRGYSERPAQNSRTLVAGAAASGSQQRRHLDPATTASGKRSDGGIRTRCPLASATTLRRQLHPHRPPPKSIRRDNGIQGLTAHGAFLIDARGDTSCAHAERRCAAATPAAQRGQVRGPAPRMPKLDGRGALLERHPADGTTPSPRRAWPSRENA
jgi:hypothetical protein